MTKLVVDEDYINERTTFFESSTGQLLSEFKEFKIASNLTSKDEIEAVKDTLDGLQDELGFLSFEYERFLKKLKKAISVG